MTYTPTDWVDDVTPVDEARMDKIEQGIVDAHDGLPPDPTGEDGKWLTVSGGAMVWAPLTVPPGIEYENDWAAGTAYQAGDVVRHNGIDYLAVNPSTGQTPGAAAVGGFGTNFPGSPFDGQEFTLVDSLTAPTYSWKFRYVAAKASNKWVFVGGAPLYSEVLTAESTSSTTFVALTTAGPSLVIPVAGLYVVDLGMSTDQATTTRGLMSYDIGGTGAVDADGVVGFVTSVVSTLHLSRAKAKTLTATTLTAKYRVTSATSRAFQDRWMRATPVAVGG